MMLATLLLISLSVALPSVYTAGQREREEELIFRGNEYARAIVLFRRQFRRYPASVKELLQTNGIRFLRREYPDPMSRKGKWRFIHADANGRILDSRTYGRPPSGSGPGLQGGPSGAPAGQPVGPAPEATREPRETSAFFGSDKEIQGAFIVGVASASRRRSIRVLNGRTRYDEWEFIGVEVTPAGLSPAAPGQPSSPSAAPPGTGTVGPASFTALTGKSDSQR